MANEYTKGQRVKISGTFTVDGSEEDPPTVRGKYRNPLGETTTLTYGEDVELVRTDTGDYYFLISANQVGTWLYKMWSTGGVVAAEEGMFLVSDLFD